MGESAVRSHLGTETVSDSVKQQVLRKAVQLFDLHGYAKVSVQDIVDAVGVTKGAFYYYFKSKDELLELIHDEYLSHAIETAEQVLEKHRSARERLVNIVYDLIETVEKYKDFVTVVHDERRHLSAAMRKKRDRYREIVTGIIRQGMEAGEFRDDMDPAILALGIFGMCNWTYRWYRPGGRYNAREIARMFIAMVLQGLEATGRPAPF